MPTKKEKQPLSVTHPELAKEADGWDPNLEFASSEKALNWTCKNSHKYSARVRGRTFEKKGCPYCAGQKVLPGFNDLASGYPQLASQAFEWDPSTVSRASNRKLKWKCDLDHLFEARVYSRTKNGHNCPYCSGRRVLVGHNDLQTTHPKIAVEAYGWDPTLVSRGSNLKKSWKCHIGHIWEVSPNKRTGELTNCPFCSGHRVLAGFNDLSTTHSEIAKNMIDEDPRKFTAGSEKKVKWKCAKGHTYTATVIQIAIGGGCAVCSGRQVHFGFNDLQSLFPQIASEAHGWDPSNLTANSNKKLEWKCQQGHIFSRSITNRTTRTNRCPICSGHEVLFGFNDLQTLYPPLALEANGWDPTAITPGSGKKVSWICKAGHEFKAQIANRAIRQDNCPICSGKQVLPGFNDLKTTHPELARELVNKGLALKISSGSDRKLSWICNQGHTWKTSVANRKAGNGCPSCAISGFDPNKSGHLYFLEHSRWEMFQIGITNFPEDRLGSHKKLGWELLELRGPMDGHLTQQWETAILRMLKTKGADLSNAKIAGKFDGYSEAWSKSTFEVKSIKELMRLTEEFEAE